MLIVSCEKEPIETQRITDSPIATAPDPFHKVAGELHLLPLANGESRLVTLWRVAVRARRPCRRR